MTQKPRKRNRHFAEAGSVDRESFAGECACLLCSRNRGIPCHTPECVCVRIVSNSSLACGGRLVCMHAFCFSVLLQAQTPLDVETLKIDMNCYGPLLDMI